MKKKNLQIALKIKSPEWNTQTDNQTDRQNDRQTDTEFYYHRQIDYYLDNFLPHIEMTKKFKNRCKQPNKCIEIFYAKTIKVT